MEWEGFLFILMCITQVISKTNPWVSETLQPHHIFGRLRGIQQMDSAGDQLQS